MTIDDRAQITPILKKIGQRKFVAGYHAEEPELMGLLMAEYFQWDGLDILKATFSALEDSNFHSVSDEIQAIIDRLNEQWAENHNETPRDS